MPSQADPSGPPTATLPPKLSYFFNNKASTASPPTKITSTPTTTTTPTKPPKSKHRRHRTAPEDLLEALCAACDIPIQSFARKPGGGYTCTSCHLEVFEARGTTAQLGGPAPVRRWFLAEKACVAPWLLRRQIERGMVMGEMPGRQ